MRGFHFHKQRIGTKAVTSLERAKEVVKDADAVISVGHCAFYIKCIVPSTWNFSPKDAKEQRRASEQALIKKFLYSSKKTLEVLRTVHSFDPCCACAIQWQGGSHGI